MNCLEKAIAGYIDDGREIPPLSPQEGRGAYSASCTDGVPEGVILQAEKFIVSEQFPLLALTLVVYIVAMLHAVEQRYH